MIRLLRRTYVVVREADELLCDRYKLEIDRCGFFDADTDISKIFKSCFLLRYQK